MKKIELLAPAGDFDSLRAAVENGAGAVYLGGRLFNARQSAANFDDNQLRAAIEYAHIRGVKIYLTLNTLIADTEIRQALEFAYSAYAAGIDGIIVQDIGLAGLLHKALPGLPLHGSTQMTIYDVDGVKALEGMGFKRVVLAREVPLEEIAHIVKNTSLEIEIFVHGALCVCYSGQCLMSSIIGGRSGNRGRCAQPCRLPYELGPADSEKNSHIFDPAGFEKSRYSHGPAGFEKSRYSHGSADSEKSRYLLSPKDLCLLSDLNEIAAAGVDSIKIEGRMKGPEYVSSVVSTYRKYLDIIESGAAGESKVIGLGKQDAHGKGQSIGLGKSDAHGKGQAIELDKLDAFGKGQAVRMDESNASSKGQAIRIDEKDMHNLMQVFNRGGFTKGYFHGKTGKDMMCFEKPKNWGTYLGTVVSYNPQTEIVKIKLEQNLSMGDGIEIWNGENKSPGNIVSYLRETGRNTASAPQGSIAEVGYIRGRISKGQHVYKTSDKKLNIMLNETWSGKPGRKVKIRGSLVVRKDVPLKLTVTDKSGNIVSSEGRDLPQQAVNKALTVERLKEQLGKTGNTPFEFEDIDIVLEEGLALPVSEINEVRRSALEKLERARVEAIHSGRDEAAVADAFNNFIEQHFQGTNKGTEGAKPIKASESIESYKISLFYYKWDKSTIYSKRADRIYLPYRCLLDPDGERVVNSCKNSGQEVVIQLPSITRGRGREALLKAIETAVLWKADGFLAGNPGTVRYLKETTGLKIYGDIGLNVFNSQSAAEAAGLGAEGVTLSPELTLEQINSLDVCEDLPLEVVVYGRLQLMVSEYCPVGAVKGGFGEKRKCSGCCAEGENIIIDRMGVEFPILCDNLNCRALILNSSVLFVPESLSKLSLGNSGSLRLNIWNESPEMVDELVDMHRDLANKDLACRDLANRDLTCMDSVNRDSDNRDFTSNVARNIAGNTVGNTAANAAGNAAGSRRETAKYENLIGRIKSQGFTKGHFYKGVL